MKCSRRFNKTQKKLNLQRKCSRTIASNRWKIKIGGKLTRRDN